MKKKFNFIHSRLQLLLVAFGLMTAHAATAEQSVNYINTTLTDAGIYKQVSHDGNTCSNYAVFSDQASLSAGWYLTNATKVTSRVTVSGEVHIILADGVTKELTNGITTEPGAKLYIHPQSETSVGSGQYTYTCGLTLYGADNKAAIYVNDDKNSPAELHIMGGNITAKGGHDAAGIGANDELTHGPIHIYAGNINAKGGTYGAGIGGSNDSGANVIYIYGGDVTAVGGDDAAGIGGGDDGAGGICHLYGGLIKAYGGDQGAGIGGGADGHGGEVTVYAAMVEAQGGGDGAGVGGGYKGNGGKVVVHNGALIASGDFTHDDTTGGGQSSNGGSGAGIGGGKYGNGADVIINGGTVVANGGMKMITDIWQMMVNPEAQLGAGIGSGHEGKNGGSVTINGGSVTATADSNHAMASIDKAHAIGGGDEAEGGVTFTLTGGTVKLGSADNVIGDDDGWATNNNITIPNTYCVKYAEDLASAQAVPVLKDLRQKYLRDESTSVKNVIFIEPCTHSFVYERDAEGHSGSCVFCEETVAHTAHTYEGTVCSVCHYNSATGAQQPVNYITRSFDRETNNGGTYTPTAVTRELTGDYTVFGSQTSLSAGWYITDGTTVSSRVSVSGEVHLILATNVTKKVTKGFTLNTNAKLYIHPQAEAEIPAFDAHGNVIGYQYLCGLDITNPDEDKAGVHVQYDNGGEAELHIMGGNINVQGGHDAAGIGGNDNRKHGDIHIYSGNITAKGGKYGAGIGGGNDYDKAVGNLYVYGGTITAIGGLDGAGIGGGDDGKGGNCYFYNGIINAFGGNDGAGIGGGCDGNGGEVYVYRAVVEAQGGCDGAGIGGGYKGHGGKFEIWGGTVVASGDYKHDNETGGGQSSNGGSGAGIGGGKYGKGGTVIVHDGTVSANGGMKAISDMWQYMVDAEAQLGAGIGSGHEGEDGGSVTIEGGSVTATADDHHALASMDKAHAIGGGDEGEGSVTFTLTGGTVTLGSADNVIGNDDGWANNNHITIPDNYCVKYTVDFAQAEGIPVTADLRYKYLRDESTSVSNHLIIAPCTHNLYYTFDESKHTAHCPFCLFTAEDTHDYDSSKTCTVCGYKDDGSNVSRATAYQATGTTDGGYETTGTTTMVINNNNYVLPACTYTPEGWTFAGWKVSAPADVTSWAADGSTKLYKPGDTYKVTEDVSFIASFYNFESTGEGTEASPYLISTEDAMSHLAAVVNGGVSFEGIYFKLTADLNYSENNYTPIGTRNGLDEKPFKGVFDGASHKISGISIAQDAGTSTACRGIFGFIRNGVIKNLTIANSTITGIEDVGGIVGLNYYGQIYNCHALAGVTLRAINDSRSSEAGGIVGYNLQGKVEGCTSSATIYGEGSNICSTGGIAGVNDGSAMNDCLYYGNSVNKPWQGGAVVGRSLNSDGIYSSYSHCLYNPAVTTVTSGVGHSSNPGMEGPVYAYRTVTSGTDDLKLNFANYSGADYAYEYDGVIRVKNVGLLYQNKMYAMGGATVKFAVAKPEGYTISGVTASAGDLTANNDGTFTLVMPNDADVTITATVTPITVTLEDNANNSATLDAYEEVLANTVTISGRTLSKSDWNTLCLPFDMDATQIAASDLAGATIKELNSAESNLSTTGETAGTLTLKFNEVYSGTAFDTGYTKLEAGKPYIVKWTTTGDNISNPTFRNVTITRKVPQAVEFAIEGSTDKCQFGGQFSPFSIVASGATGSNQGNLNEILMLGAGSKLGYSNTARTLKSFRAHFFVPADPATGETPARRFVLDFGDGSQETGIIGMSADIKEYSPSNTAVYTLDGRRLQGQPTQKGLYIVNGKKVVIK